MDELNGFLQRWIDPSKRNKAELEQIFLKFTGKSLKDCIKCQAKAITELRKIEFKSVILIHQKKYILKPGNHCFIQGDKPYNNDNITDQLAEWYINNYPHTKSLFVKIAE